ncbi:alpha-L-rhamnosidase N-terminal domain-containing protein [Streptomyces griseoruber]|uniref:alpha-L-rhamnosidase N-terminal domain-containing protein n=1 Tax=Streptomyces griseoruber TaxID=1943 RepID=UPI003792D66E
MRLCSGRDITWQASSTSLAHPEPLYCTSLAHGLYEAFLNGERVGDRELTPGFTAYRKRLQVQSFDVSGLVLEGVNALGALLSYGWWRAQTGVARGTDSFLQTVRACCRLPEDGSRQGALPPITRSGPEPCTRRYV